MNKVYEKDGYVLRLAEKEDAEEYFENNFRPFVRDSSLRISWEQCIIPSSSLFSPRIMKIWRE